MLIPSLLLTGLLFGGEKVVINEFLYDDSSTDTHEFVEIYNPTGKAIDISGWKLTGSDPTGANAVYTVPANTTLAAGAFYVFGSALVPNVDQIVGVSNLWENSQESLVLIDGDGNIIDSVVYEANKGLWSGAESEMQGIWGNHVAIEGRESSWSRLRDGHDTNNNRDFVLRPWTPGKTNNLATGFIIENFDSLTVSAPLKDWGGSWADATAIDPTRLDAGGYNPNVIKASPQGGKAAIFWDKTGGGNMNMLLKDVGANVTVECYVYFDAAARPTGEYESWSIGLQGTTGTYYNTPDPSGTYNFTANGNTGVTLTYQVDSAGANIYLIDHGQGGWGTAAKRAPKILGTLAIKTGTNDGWQRVRFTTSGNQVEARIGGTFGSTTTGSKLSGTLSSPSEGDLYVGYRELMTANTATRPLTIDNLWVTPVGFKGGIDTSGGTAKATTVSTPRLGGNGIPAVGNSSFELSAVGLVPNGNSFWGLGLPTTPIDLSIAGGQKGSFLQITVLAAFNVTASADGDASLKAGIPNNAALKGSKITLQVLDVDPALSVGFKVGNSRAVQYTID